MQLLQPVRIDHYSTTELLVEWASGERFAVPFIELRFHCPCAGCVDEHTGQRRLERDAVELGVRATSVQVVGRYALAIHWTDGHTTGIYHFDYLHDLCGGMGRRL